MPTSSGAERELLTSVHCLVRAARRPATVGAPPGLDGDAPVRVIDGGDGLWLAVSDVPAASYEAAAIDAGLRDMDWVARHAIAHEHVVEHFQGRGALIPMKLFTLYRNDERALADVEGRREALERVFDEVRGKDEWGVRMLAAAPPAGEEPRPVPRAAGSSSPGTDFLKRKQEARASARAWSEELAGAADALFSELEGLAARARRAERLPESAGARVVLEGAFLVPTRAAALFREAVERGAQDGRERGLEVVLTGPWAAYHFVEAGP